ncbi:hypothetical protein HK100_008269, partial [Physocladia obscura]
MTNLTAESRAHIFKTFFSPPPSPSLTSLPLSPAVSQTNSTGEKRLLSAEITSEILHNIAVNECIGLNFADIVTLVSESVNFSVHSLPSSSKNTVNVTVQSLRDAIAKVSAQTRRIGAHGVVVNDGVSAVAPAIGFGNVGGLDGVKEFLLESLFWGGELEAAVPQVFATKGILLYGP